VVTDAAMYCFGKKTEDRTVPPRPTPTEAAGPPTYLRVTPTELILQPGDKVRFHAWSYDERGLPVREEEAEWSIEGIDGAITSGGELTVADTKTGQAGTIKAVSTHHDQKVAGAARARVIAPLPWNESFDDRKPGPPPGYWINAAGKFEVREMDGGNVLVKLSSNPATQRARITMGPTDWKDYTVQVDVRATEKRRQMGDAGIVAQRYSLVLFGNHQRLEMHPWQADPNRTVQTGFAWQKDTWYTMKLRVENLPGGNVKVLGKVWPAADPEPSAWTIEHVDPVPSREGSPGLYASAPFEIFFDNYKVTPNE
jgi:hypothetical protein